MTHLVLDIHINLSIMGRICESDVDFVMRIGKQDEKTISLERRRKRAFQANYYLGYLTVYFILVTTNWFFLVDTSNPRSLVLFGTMAFLFIGLAYNIMDLICYFLVSEDDLPRLTSLPKGKTPKVAVLYCTYNDCDTDCLKTAGEQDHPVKVYVLDDSTDPEKMRAVDYYASLKGFKVLRREQRTGYKAGALNNWLKLYGQDFDYIAVMDSDSKLPRDFISSSLAYAEHPANAKVSIFQARVNVYNRDNKFTDLMALSPALWYPSYRKLANRLDWMMCWGHNNLLRVSHLLEVKGWDEHHVSEDFALAMALRRKQKRAVLTPIDTYETCPPDFEAYKRRACRWAKGTLKCFEFLGDDKILPSTRFMLFLTGWCTLAFFGYLIALVLMVYGFSSNLGMVMDLSAVFTKGFTWFSARPGAFVLVAFYFSFLIFGRMALVRQSASSVKEYMSHICLGLSINMMLTLPMVYHQLKVLFGSKVVFEVTPKKKSNSLFTGFIKSNSGHIVLTGILLIGALTFNPISIVYNAFWLSFMVLAPIVIWKWQNTPSGHIDPVKTVKMVGSKRPMKASAAMNVVVQAALTK
jgi:cellulose synthase/poly-beta-1,6-N-acetylglucosamine synthase-like glycosyltransferase